MNSADIACMDRAVQLGESVRGTTAPNPWVGAVLVTSDGTTFGGATEPPPGRHAEIVALDAARRVGADVAGAALYTTLEPCSHTGRTSPCADAIVHAGIARVCVGVTDPDPQVAGTGIEMLRAAGVEVEAAASAGAALSAEEADAGADANAALTAGAELSVHESLGPYLHQRRTGRPWVVLKLAATLDGRIGAPDGTSQWITSPEARADAHALRARCDAVLVGAGTVRADNPRLTVRELPADDPRRPLLERREAHRTPPPSPSITPGPSITPSPPITDGAARRLDPRRFVLGSAPPEASVHPCTEVSGPLPEVLERMAADGVVDLLVEGGAHVAGELHRAGLVDEYVVYLAPALMGGSDGLPLLAGSGAATVSDLWRGRITETRQVGPDLRITIHPALPST